MIHLIIIISKCRKKNENTQYVSCNTQCIGSIELAIWSISAKYNCKKKYNISSSYDFSFFLVKYPHCFVINIYCSNNKEPEINRKTTDMRAKIICPFTEERLPVFRYSNSNSIRYRRYQRLGYISKFICNESWTEYNSRQYDSQYE